MAREYRALAGCSNVAIKISALGTYDPEPSRESFRSIIDPIVEAFGSNRAMFASDYPVGGLQLSFDEIYGLFRDVAGSYSEDEQRDLFCETARRIYQIETP